MRVGFHECCVILPLHRFPIVLFLKYFDTIGGFSAIYKGQHVEGGREFEWSWSWNTPQEGGWVDSCDGYAERCWLSDFACSHCPVREGEPLEEDLG